MAWGAPPHAPRRRACASGTSATWLCAVWLLLSLGAALAQDADTPAPVPQPTRELTPEDYEFECVLRGDCELVSEPEVPMTGVWIALGVACGIVALCAIVAYFQRRRSARRQAMREAQEAHDVRDYLRDMPAALDDPERALSPKGGGNPLRSALQGGRHKSREESRRSSLSSEEPEAEWATTQDAAQASGASIVSISATGDTSRQRFDASESLNLNLSLFNNSLSRPRESPRRRPPRSPIVAGRGAFHDLAARRDSNGSSTPGPSRACASPRFAQQGPGRARPERLHENRPTPLALSGMARRWGTPTAQTQGPAICSWCAEGPRASLTCVVCGLMCDACSLRKHTSLRPEQQEVHVVNRCLSPRPVARRAPFASSSLIANSVAQDMPQEELDSGSLRMVCVA